MKNNLISMTLAELGLALKDKKTSSVEVTKAYIDEIKKRGGEFNCFVTKAFDEALKQAALADARLAKNDKITPLTGIPLAIKDIFITKGIRTTCCSKILGNYVPPYDGTVVEKLKNAGAIITGKLNMDEFAMGSSNEFSAFGPVKNPWNTQYTPGGSSGGSAAAVAAGLSVASLGTDTGGSIRQPASFCGIVGLKPTYGRVSRYGIIAFASSLDQVGPMTRNVTDCAIMLGAIAGHDERDSTSIPNPVPDYTKALTADVKGKTIGIPEEYSGGGCDAEVEKGVMDAIKVLEKLGVRTKKIRLPHTQYAVPCYYIIAPAEASANLARYDGIRYGHRARDAAELEEVFKKSRTEGFGPEVALRIVVGTYVLSSGYYDAYYLKAQKVRTLIKNDFIEAFKTCDAIITPTTPTCAFKLGDKIDDPVKMYLNDIYTIPVNLAGLPAMSVPCGFNSEKLPIGLQIIGRPLDEESILNIAFAYEKESGWNTNQL